MITQIDDEFMIKDYFRITETKRLTILIQHALLKSWVFRFTISAEADWIHIIVTNFVNTVYKIRIGDGCCMCRFVNEKNRAENVLKRI